MTDKQCKLKTAECPWYIHEGDDFLRTLTWFQVKDGPRLDLTGYLAELWINPNDPDGEEFLVSSNGTTTPGTSITIDGPNGVVVILLQRAVIPDLKLTQGALSRFDLTNTVDVKSAQFRTKFVYEKKYGV